MRILMLLLLLEGLAQARVFDMEPPASAPRTGEMAYCPSFAVLSDNHKLSDPGPSWGYYLIEWENLNGYRDRRPRIVAVNAGKLAQWADKEVPLATLPWSQVGKADVVLRDLWGYRCAYWNDPGIAQLLDGARRQYQSALGIDADAEARLHTAMLDKKKWQATRDALCKPGPGPLAATLADVGCKRGVRDVHPLQAALDAGRDVELARALYLVSCINDLDYADYRLCNLVAEGINDDAVRQAVAPLAEPLRTLVFVNVQIGRWHLRADAAKYAAMEADSPADKKLVDDAIAAARTHAERIAPWRADLEELDAWVASLDKGPRALDGCEQKLSHKVQAYLDKAVPTPVSDALLDALAAPGGFAMVQALALCRSRTGDRTGERVLEWALARGNGPARGFHARAGELINLWPQQNNGVYDGWNLKYLKNNRGPGGYTDALTRVYQVGARTDSPPDQTGVVFQAKPQKDGRVLVTFKKQTDWRLETVGCRETRQVDSIDEDGRIRYRLKGCKDKKVKFDATPRPLLVPAGTPLRAGMSIGYAFRADMRGREDDNSPEEAVLFFAKDGKNVVTAAGFTPTP